jgi:hypothetical protein
VKLIIGWMKRKQRANKTQSSEPMFKDKVHKLENRIFLRRCTKLLCKVNMNVRSTISRICLIQFIHSLISSWVVQLGKRNTCTFKNENVHYFDVRKCRGR